MESSNQTWQCVPVVIDAHLHLWNTERLHYQWLQRPENAAINRTFGFGDFASRAAAAGVDRAVLVQADDTAADTEAMFEVAAARSPGCRPRRRRPARPASWA
jgi:predicted TIM-barrel fold metal-dependent hydrolase